MTLVIDIDGEQHALPEGGGRTIGRRAELAPNDPTLSRQHFRIEQRDGEWWLEDLASASGTWHNGAQVRMPVALADGDQLRAGRTTFTVHID